MNNNRKLILNYYHDELLNYDKDFYDEYGIYIKPHGYTISSRKIESYIQIAHIQKYLQCNPTRAIDIFFNIELLDGQALLVQRSWITPMIPLSTSYTQSSSCNTGGAPTKNDDDLSPEGVASRDGDKNAGTKANE